MTQIVPLAAAAGIIGLGALLHLVGMATPHWVDVGLASSGLWSACAMDNCGALVDKQGWLIGCEVLSVIGVSSSAAALMFIAIIFFNEFKGRSQNSKFSIFLLADSLMAGTCIIICIAVYASKVHDTSLLGYSFYLAIVGGVLIKIGGIIGFIISRRLSYGAM
ncbi:uncharacterized protein LOC131944802 [Physella acuta]|uniref:uncharacterized protein LOC131944802 n=1 Tax=Physella acuta TaxID=109671 RepID=UPI0027DE866F|nr:uncharacterized protein LOC131944802 [Physella acuta]XP_059161602.1 uncharacterized protein LOC131944802 [Physella acuta]